MLLSPIPLGIDEAFKFEAQPPAGGRRSCRGRKLSSSRLYMRSLTVRRCRRTKVCMIGCSEMPSEAIISKVNEAT